MREKQAMKKGIKISSNLVGSLQLMKCMLNILTTSKSKGYCFKISIKNRQARLEYAKTCRVLEAYGQINEKF